MKGYKHINNVKEGTTVVIKTETGKEIRITVHNDASFVVHSVGDTKKVSFFSDTSRKAWKVTDTTHIDSVYEVKLTDI